MNNTTKNGNGALTVEVIREKLFTDDKWLERGLLALYEGQTQDEKSVGETEHSNGVGLNGYDAPFYSSLAIWVLQGRTLTQGQKKALRKDGSPSKGILKYAGQLLRLAQTQAPVEEAKTDEQAPEGDLGNLAESDLAAYECGESPVEEDWENYKRPEKETPSNDIQDALNILDF